MSVACELRTSFIYLCIGKKVKVSPYPVVDVDTRVSCEVRTSSTHKKVKLSR
jgi:hypothetical protein